MFHTESKGLPIPGRLFCLSGVPKLVGVDALIDPFSSMDGLYRRVDVLNRPLRTVNRPVHFLLTTPYISRYNKTKTHKEASL